MKYSIRDKVWARINKIQDNGCFCTLSSSQFGFMPNYLMPSFFDENGNFTKSVGDKVLVVINKINEKGFITLSDEVSFEKEQEKLRKKEEKIAIRQRIENFASTYEKGVVFDGAVVTKVGTNKVHIQLGDVEGIIPKEELNYNVIESPEEVVFVGEQLKVVYIGFETNQLKFSLKYLNDKPYDENLYNLPLEELLKLCGIMTNKFIGQAKTYGKVTFIENLYSDGNENGKLLVDPFYGYNLRAIVPNANFHVEEGKYYKIEISLVSKDKRLERNQLFQFCVRGDVQECENPYKTDVKLTFEMNTSPATNVTVAHLLAEVGKNMYSSKDRMFYELIQNADDAAAKSGVSVDVVTQGDYLILRHNGYSFNKEDFSAITSAANGTKKANKNKTGYKGIGFKSVFTDSNIVYIKSGGYQFKFDKADERFTNFDEFYFLVNGCTTEEQKQKFLQKFNLQKEKFKGVEDIPWQLEPIWVDSFSQFGRAFENSNVAIALKLGANKIEGDDGYESAINNIICNPNLMLFLRNTKRIQFNKFTISKDTNGDKIVIKNSFNNNRVEDFERVDFNADINNDVFQHYGIDIRIKVDEEDENTGKIIEAKFVDIHGQELENIPKKIAINKSTSISFAIPTDDDGIKPNTRCEGISMFAFLPTLVKDFKFPFYINANFILDPPRQRILGDNPWNYFLMHVIGEKLVQWCATLCARGDRNALNVLLKDYFDESSSPDTNALAHYFNSAYKQALESEAFILNQSGELAKQKDIIIDKTGLGTSTSPNLSQIFGPELFCKILRTDKQLPSPNIDSNILSRKIFENIDHIEKDDILEELVDNEDLRDWYINTDSGSKDKFNKWLIDNDCADVINSLPIFKFADGWKSCNEIEQNVDYVVISEKLSPIKSVLEKLDFYCSENTFDDCPFKEAIDPINDEDLFEEIVSRTSKQKLEPREKLSIIQIDFTGVGEKKISTIELFNNILGTATPLENMLPYRDDAPEYVSPYMICKEENFTELSDYLIKNEDEFADVVWSNIDVILQTASPIDIIERYDLEGRQYTYVLHMYNSHNVNGEPTYLENLLPYRADAPDYLNPYMICEEENIPELQKYLISVDDEFDKVIWPHIDEILKNALPIDIINRYNLNGQGQQLRYIIKKYDSNEELVQFLPIVEYSDTETKEFFLSKIKEIRLSDSQSYNKESFEYRVLQIAVDVLATPSDFSKKIFYNDTCITEFSVKDEVDCEYDQAKEKKHLKFSLARLLPQYQNQSNSIERIKSLFETKKDLDKFFDAKSKSENDVESELNNGLGIIHATYDPWKANAGNAQQYLFSVYRRKKSWSVVLGLKINLSQETDAFIHEMLTFLFENQIDITTSPFTYHVEKYFNGLYFKNDFIFEEEQILPSIEKWADTPEKNKYLFDNGTRDENSKAIKFRKDFCNNQKVDIENISDEDAFAALKYFAKAKKQQRPFSGENQKDVLLNIHSRNNNRINDHIDSDLLAEKSNEWNTNNEYKQWRYDKKPTIFLFYGEMPCYLEYDDERLTNYSEGNYWYDKAGQRLYINASSNIDDLLFEIARGGQSGLTLDDYQTLCRKGKVSIAETKLKELQDRVKDYDDKNALLQRYIEKYGNIDEKKVSDATNSPTTATADTEGNIETLIEQGYDVHKTFKNLSTAQEAYNETYQGEIYKRDGVAIKDQIDFHKEAMEAAKLYLKRNDFDLSESDYSQSVGDFEKFQKWRSACQIHKVKTPSGEYVNVIVKSCKGGFVYLSATDFQSLTSSRENILILYDKNGCSSVSYEELFAKGSDVNLIFDSEYTPHHYYAALGKIFTYIKRSTFAVKNPRYNVTDEIKGFGMDSETQGLQNESDDDNDL